MTSDAGAYMSRSLAAVLSLSDITAGYGGAPVVSGVCLEVPHGKVAALLGPNGAGKTTLLRVASGVLRPSHGTVTLDGRDVTASDIHVRAQCGLCDIPEGRGIFPSLTVRENLVLQSPRGTESDSIDQAIRVFPELGNRLRQLAGSLSGGEQQMLALCRAYITDPKIVILDEVSLGLAPIIVGRIFERLQALSQLGTSLLLVEQYVTRALELADRAYVLDRGKIVFAGNADDLAERDIFETYLGLGSVTQ